MNLGHAIKLCRTQKGLTQSELAKLADISVSYLSLLESNKRDPNFSTVRKISSAINIPFSVLVFLAADRSELATLEKELVEKMSYTALELIHESNGNQTIL